MDHVLHQSKPYLFEQLGVAVRKELDRRGAALEIMAFCRGLSIVSAGWTMMNQRF